MRALERKWVKDRQLKDVFATTIARKKILSPSLWSPPCSAACMTTYMNWVILLRSLQVSKGRRCCSYPLLVLGIGNSFYFAQFGRSVFLFAYFAAISFQHHLAKLVADFMVSFLKVFIEGMLYCHCKVYNFSFYCPLRYALLVCVEVFVLAFVQLQDLSLLSSTLLWM